MIKFSIGISTCTLLVLIGNSCTQTPLYQQGKYTIKKKKLMSYYSASPDLFVKTDSGTAKINLNPFSHNLFPQENIIAVQISDIGADSVFISFTARENPTADLVEDHFGINIKYCVDSILTKKN